MSRRLQIHAALAAAALLAQLALPFAHGVGAAGGLPLAADRGPAVVSVPSHPSTVPAHDPILCPACTALHQARSGLARTPDAAALPLSGALIAHGCDPAHALPRTPDLAAAAPRAPPIRPLAFA